MSGSIRWARRLDVRVIVRDMELVTPFPVDRLTDVWQWAQEFPSANFDDYGANQESDFIEQIKDRMKREVIWGVTKESRLCGIVAFLPITNRMGTFHGICFAKGHCSFIEKRRAVQGVIDSLFSLGIEKICATYFSDNVKIDRFLADLGAIEEGVLRKHTVRGGVLVDMKQVAIFRKEG